MSTLYADLHNHTVQSDGELTLNELTQLASERGLNTIAITDHDRTHPNLTELYTSLNGVTVISGIELRVKMPTGDRIDILGYGVDETQKLTAELNRIQQNRKNRAQKIIENVEEEIGIENLEITPTPSTGRPHIARAIDAHPEIRYTYEEAFNELIGNDDPAYVARDITDFETGVRLLKESCEFIVLAHPYRYDNASTILKETTDFDGVERNYPYNHEQSLHELDDHIQKHNLLYTGGSDTHEDDIGTAGLSKEEFKPISEKLGL